MAQASNRKIIPFVAPTATIPDGFYSPNLCPTCKCDIRDGQHGWVSGGYDKERMKTITLPCPTCTGDARVQAVAHKQAELVARLFGGSHIPFYARNWEFATFPQDAHQEARKQVEDFVERLLKGDEKAVRGLFLGGGAGRGKTGLAVSALKRVMQHGHLALFVMTAELMNRLRASYGEHSTDTADELLKAVTDVPWLVLDDLAVERPTRYVLEQFYYIIEKRRAKGLYTIFTSNLSTKDLEAYWRPENVKAGAFHDGVRIVERIREYCLGIAMDSRNLRERGKA